MNRIALGLHYDGAAFSGWQSQPHRNTVQDHLEDAIERFAGVRLLTTVAGRTDTGVHALGQVIHLDTGLEREPFSWVRAGYLIGGALAIGCLGVWLFRRVRSRA